MPGEPTSAIEVFCCYARKDQPFLHELRKHLRPFERDGRITIWYDKNISPGTEWEEEINKHLNAAQIILLLISPDFMASEYCYSKEMKRAMERHEAREARVIPVIVRSVAWENTILGKLQVLPTNAKPIAAWRGSHGRDNAFQDIAQGIQIAVKEQLSILASQKTKEQWMDEGCALDELGYNQMALAAFQLVIQLDPDNASAYDEKGYMLNKLGRYEEALTALEHAVHLDNSIEIAYSTMAETLRHLGRIEEAKLAEDQARQISRTSMNTIS